jgi:serpin B
VTALEAKKKSIVMVLSLSIMVLFWTECENPSAGSATETENIGANVHFVKSDVPRKAPQISSDLLNRLVKNNTEFGLDLYKKLRTSGANIFFSPYSISEAVAMVYAGAKNETSAQIASALRFTLPDSIIHAGFDSIDLALTRLASFNNDFTINNANSIWMQESLSIQKNFLDLLAAYYNAGLYTVDFIRAHDSSTTAINNWMSEMTSNRINNCLSPNSLTTATRLVLANALYFKSMWNDTFSVENTRDSTFFNLNSTISTVPFMHAEMRENGYYETDRYQCAELLLAGLRTSMIIVMPKPGFFNIVEDEFTLDTLYHIFSMVKELALLDLAVPKFFFETASYNIGSILSSMGMTDAFIPGTADFSGINGKRDLYLGSVSHKGYIGVNEWGVEAAAATPEPMIPAGMVPIKTMSIDHPFILFIRYRWTNTILFMGRITKL